MALRILLIVPLTIAALAWASVAELGALQSAPQRVAVPSTPSCQDCRIVLEKVVSIGKLIDDVIFDNRVQIVRNSRGEFFAAPLRDIGRVAQYDSLGNFVQLLGVLGEGPMEFRRASSIDLGFGDTLLVFDLSGRKVGRFAPGTRTPVMRALPPVPSGRYALLPSGGLASVQAAPSGDRALVVQVHESADTPRATFGRMAVPEGESGALPRLIPTPDGRSLWSIYHGMRLMDRYSVDGRHELSWRREANWPVPAPPQRAGAPGNETAGPTLIGGAYNGRYLWIHFDVPQLRIAPDPRPDDYSAEHLFARLSQVRDGWVEVLDVESGRVVTSQRFDEHVYPVRGAGGMVFTLRRDEDGLFVADIWRARLVGLPGGQSM